MKKLIILLFVLPFISLGQDKVKGYVELTHNVPFLSLCFDSYLTMGLSFHLKYGTISPLVGYAFGGNYKNNSPKPYNNVPAYRLNFHLLGGGIKYSLRNENKIYRPSFTALFFTDAGSSYRGGYLLNYMYNNDGVALMPVNSYISLNEYEKGAYCYISMPFVINVYFGNEFKIYRGLRINLGVGYLGRAVKTQYKIWYLTDPIPPTNLSHKYSLKDVEWFHRLNLSFGLNYTFSFKKKSKTETP